MSTRWQWHLSKAATVVVLLGMAVLAAIGWLAHREAGRMVVQLEGVSRSHHLSEQMAKLLVIVGEEESFLRGYLLAGDTAFLAQRSEAAAHFAAGLQALKELASDNPEHLRDARELENQFAQRLAWSARTLEIYAGEGRDAAVAQFSQGAGATINREIRGVVSGMALREANLDGQSHALIERANRTVFWMVPAGGVLGVLLLSLSLVFLNREAMRRHQSQLERDRFFDGSVDMLAIADFEGRFERVNPAWTRCLGWTAQELTTHPWLSFVHPDDHALTIAESSAMMSQGKEAREFENRYLCKDGSYRWLSWSGRAYKEAQQFYVVARDITESRKLREQIGLLEACVSKLNDIVVITEAEPQALPGPRIVYVNDAFVRRTGFTREEVIGQTPRLLQGPKTQRDALARIGNAMGQWQPVREELINYTKAGEEFWIELDITPVADALGWYTHWVAIERDITTRKAADNRLQLAASVFAQSRDGILITDALGGIVEVNAAFERITGYAASDVLGKTPRILQSGRHGPEFYAAMWRSINEEGHWFGEAWNRRLNGEIYPEMLSVVAIKDAQGVTQNYAAVFNDMTELRAHQNLLERVAKLDPLTGLPNRAQLAVHAEQEMVAAQRSGEAFVVMVMGVDHFKGVVASVGHAQGDQLLVALGGRIQSLVRDQDTLGHVPGEGFVLVISQTSANGAGILAEKLLLSLAEPFELDGKTVRITASIGVAAYPNDAHDFESLMASAASAYQRAKEMGGDGFHLFNEELHQASVENQALANALRLAVDADQLTLHYQPFVDLQSGLVCGMEALLRWTHPTLGAVSPARFIPVAEDCGAIRPIGAWVFRRACEDIRSWIARGVVVVPVAINVSPIQFRDEGLVQQVEALLAEFDIDPALITVEVTEGALVENVGRSQAILQALKSLGIKLSLDDFGTGYSSLSYLKLFPFDKVKIDQSFVRNIPANKEDGVIASVVVSMAHGLGLRVIAEGVESEAQCAFLRDHMCDEIQGYLYSKALPAADIFDMLGQEKHLPAHLLRNRTRTRTILLVDDEPNVLSALKRLFRRDGYSILSANSGQEGLDILAQHPVDVILSDQRMPGMTGVEFLRAAKQLYPSTLRIVLSGYTELQSVTDAINEGSIYRFLTKPWLDEQLRTFIQEAFEFKELADENQRLNLEVRTANSELAESNRLLQESNTLKEKLIARSELSLKVVRETLHHIPLPVIGVDDGGMVAFVNTAAVLALNASAPLLGTDLVDVLPELHAVVQTLPQGQSGHVQIAQQSFRVEWHTMGAHSTSRGKIVSLVEEGGRL